MDGFEVEELPYNYAYRRYPFESCGIPGYDPVFSGYSIRDQSTYHRNNSLYGGNAVPMFVVEAPHNVNTFLRKRKLDEMKGQEISVGGHNVVRNIVVENASTIAPNVVEGAFAATRESEFSETNATTSRHSSAEENDAYPRVISIPVISTDVGEDNVIKYTEISPGGTNKSRKVMSEVQAAVLIQSCLRGYQLRKTKPLTQLLLIAKVRSQLSELIERASDAAFVSCARENVASKLKMTEGIMNLLFELDSIQGAHPDIREIRKITTKEVISLQERVDTILSTEIAASKSSQLLNNCEESRYDHGAAIDSDTDQLLKNCEESRDDQDHGAATGADLHMEEFCDTTHREPDQETGEVSPREKISAAAELEACKVGYAALNRSIDSLLTEMCPVNCEEVSWDQGNTEKNAATDSSETVLSTVLSTEPDFRMEEEICDTSQGEPDPDKEESGISTIEGESLQRIESEICKIDVAAMNRSIDSQPNTLQMTWEKACRDEMVQETRAETESPAIKTDVHNEDWSNGTSLAGPDPDQEKGVVRRFAEGLLDEGSVETLDLEASDISEIKDSVAYDTETHAQQASCVYDKSPSCSQHEDDGEMAKDFVEPTSEAGGVRTIGNEQPVKFRKVCEGFSEDRFANEELERDEVDDRINEDGAATVVNSSKADSENSKPTVQPSLADLSMQYSPSSKSEAAECLDFQPLLSKTRHQSKEHEFHEFVQDASAQSKADNQALLLKLSEENKALKSLMITVFKWNQMQAKSMQDVNQRLGKLERRIGKVKSKSKGRRKA